MISIRQAALSDVILINELANRIWPIVYKDILESAQIDYMLDKLYSLSSLESQITEQDHKFIIVLDEKKPVGFASYSAKKENETTYKLHKIYLLADQRGQGVGKKIIEYIINEIRPQDAKTLELNVNRHNKARYFYEKIGFTITSEEDISIGNGYFMNDYVMQKVI